MHPAAAGAQEEAPVIRYHSQDGQQRIDLDDDRADDETYRAFQLARLTGEANMIVQKHEEEFREELRRRNEEREERQEQAEAERREAESQELGQPRGNSLMEVEEGAGKEKSAYERIMGTAPSQPNLGEGKEEKHDKLPTVDGEPFDAVHTKNANDIEDHDYHFVMTDEMRHNELKNAVEDLGESDEEKNADKLAKKMMMMQKRIREFNVRREVKTRHEAKQAATEEHISELMKEHNEHFDSKGRVVPDF